MTPVPAEHPLPTAASTPDTDDLFVGGGTALRLAPTAFAGGWRRRRHLGVALSGESPQAEAR